MKQIWHKTFQFLFIVNSKDHYTYFTLYIQREKKLFKDVYDLCSPGGNNVVGKTWFIQNKCKALESSFALWGDITERVARKSLLDC